MTKSYRYVFAVGILAFLLAGTFYLYTNQSLTSAEDDFKSYRLLGERVQSDFNQYPLVPINDEFTIIDSMKDGVDIQFANQVQTLSELAGEDITLQTARSGALAQVESSLEGESSPASDSLNLAFPEDLNEPLTVSLPGGKLITVTHNTEESYSRSLLTNEPDEVPLAETIPWPSGPERSLSEESSSGEVSPTYIKYTSSDNRINTYYAYQKDQAKGYRNLKHWTIFESGDGEEERSYTFENAHLSLTDSGSVEVRYISEQQLQNDQVRQDVDDDLWARAQAVVGSDLSTDITNQPPAFIIPAPYTIDSFGQQTTHDWEVSEDNSTLTVSFTVDKFSYPIALDPTLQFTAPGTSGEVDILTGETTGDYFGFSFTTGDINGDGKDDLIVGAYRYNSNQGRAYIFYGGSLTSANAATADVILTGEATGHYFGVNSTTGDLNGDGAEDLIIGASNYTSLQGRGRVYIFYGASLSSANASTADVILTGEDTGAHSLFGSNFTIADLNSDGTEDLAVGAQQYPNSFDSQGRVYIFYGGSLSSANASTADVILTGEINSGNFGESLTTGDLNNDGKDDLIVGAHHYNDFRGRVYIFYGGSLTSANASTADVILTGEASGDYFGRSLATVDFNNDGTTDLIIGADRYNSFQGRVYVFYSQSGQINLDTHTTGETAGNRFGSAMVTGDWNNDGWPDLAVGAPSYNTNTGRAYIFYGGESHTNLASTSDVIITGQSTNSFFGHSLVSGDFNNDGRDDLAVGARNYSSNAGRVYILYGDGTIPTTAAAADVIISGEASSLFGWSLATGDLNSDGRTDLVVGAKVYGASTGRAYIFYNDGSIPTTAATADEIITGASSLTSFASSLIVGDFDADGDDDLAVGADQADDVFIFYNDGSYPAGASTADVSIAGSNKFGKSLTKGDFNNDGKTDLVVTGDEGFGNNYGTAYIFYNDGSYPSTDVGADIIITGEDGSNFGTSIATGDINNDGKDDLIVAASGYSSSQGRAYVYYGGTFTSSMEAATSSSLMITGDSANDDFGSSLLINDFNRDGRGDLIIGAPGYNNGGDTGRIYYYQTKENFVQEIQRSPMTDPPRIDLLMGHELKITGEPTAGQFGESIYMADLNDDGKDDLIVSAHFYNSNQGRVYIFYNDGNYSTKASQADVILDGEGTSDFFGSALATGDVNADGTDDLIVSAHGYDGTYDNQGRAYVFYGGSLASANASTADVIFTGEATGNFFALSLTSGDLNSDGIDDLIVGAQSYNSSQGRAYVFYGGSLASANASTADVIFTGEATSNFFGRSMTTGDLNNDGTTDLVVGAIFYNSSQGRAYVFYGGSLASANASTADVILTGETTSNGFSASLITSDLNNDGIDDLIVGATIYNSSQGRAYIFYGGSLASANASTADVILTGEATSSIFGTAVLISDLNADGTNDLIVGSHGYDGTYTNQGRAYIFYGGSLASANASTADVILTGEGASNFFGTSLTTGDLNADGTDDLIVGAYGYNSNQGRIYMYTTNDFNVTGTGNNDFFGTSLASGDFNNDGKTDLVVGAYGYNSNQGRVYIFYGGNKSATSSNQADVTITGEATNNYFGASLTTGDLNSDGKDDLVVGAWGYSTNTGRTYIFYGDGSIPTTAATADVIIAGEATNNYFGYFLTTGDFNNDGKDDLAVSAYGYSSNTGRTYIFYGDGSIPTTAATADVTITGEASSLFGISLTTGDFNHDGRDDLVVSSRHYSDNTGRVYIFYGAGSIPTTAATADVIITGEESSSFGRSLTTGDFNHDGRDDLAVGADRYSSYTGRVYIFYGAGSIPTTAATADVIITGSGTNDSFGISLTTGDLNKDGKDDLVVGAYGYSTNTGRVYLFYSGEIRTKNATDANIIITGQTTSSDAGRAIYSADINNNGTDDLIIGARGYDSSDDQGRVYVLMSETASYFVASMRLRGDIKMRGSVRFR